MVDYLCGNGNLNKEKRSELDDLLLSIKNTPELKFTLKKADDCPVVPNFYFHSSSLEVNGQTINGTGESFKIDESQMKSIGECLERWPLVDSSFSWTSLSNYSKNMKLNIENSNGCAFHTNLDIAVLSAKRELIERHVILRSWLQKKDVKEVHFSLVSKLQNYFNERATNVKMKVLFFENEFDLPVFCTQINGVDCNFYGYGADLNKEKAIQKSYFEAWRFYWEYISNKKKEYSVGEDPCLKHYYHWLNNKTESPFEITNKIHFKNIKSIRSLEYNEGSIYYCDLSQKGINGFVAKVEDNSLASLWTGPLLENVDNRKKGEYHPIA